MKNIRRADRKIQENLHNKKNMNNINKFVKDSGGKEDEVK